MQLFGIDVQAGTIVVGALTGVAYGLLGVGLVLIYRSSRIINFAHGEIGAFCAAVLAKLVLDNGWSYPAAFVAVAILGALIGAAWEITVVRKLFRAPRLVLLVATIGISQVMLAGQFMIPSIDNPGRFPEAFEWTRNLFGAVLSGGHLMIVLLAPPLVAALAWFLNRTSTGVAIRASADNADTARLAGINVRHVSTLVWALSGALAAITFVLINPVRGTTAGAGAFTAALGPGLLLRALTAALVGRLVSLPQALLGGVGIGIVEALLLVNVSNPGVVDAYIAGAVVLLVIVRGAGTVKGESGSWTLAPRTRAIPEHLRAVRWVRSMPLLATSVVVAVAIVAPLVLDRPSQQFTLSRVVVYALAGLSVVVVTGWAGQLSLAQFALVGVGAVTTAGLTARGVPFGFAVVYAAIAGVVAALAIGGPALRIRGLFLAVTTLAFAVGARGWLLPHSLFFGDVTSAFVARGSWWFLELDDQRTYYYLCLAVLVAVGVATSRLRRTGVGRCILAVRDNETAAAAFTIDAASVKLSAFAVSGGIASLAGALLAGLYVHFGATTFEPAASLQLVSMVIIGGVGSVFGAILGAVYLVAIPAFTGHWVRDLLGGDDGFVLLLGGLGLLGVLMQTPGGAIQGIGNVRDRLLRRAERQLASHAEPGTAPPSQEHQATTLLASCLDEGELDSEAVVLRVEGVTVAFGGLVANRDITVEARRGEVLGLIGTNGAGKSTLMNAVSGFVPITGGRIELFGADVTGWPAHERAALGVGRVFQDAHLFPELTVRQSIAVALEARRRSELVPSLLGLPPARRIERRTWREAGDLVARFGLRRYDETPIAELSTGTRRFVELAGLVAVEAGLILLDEPTAGIAQRETEAFAPLIKQVQADLAATVVIIEHDMPLVMSLSDRIYCLSAGEVIAEGPPDVIRHDPDVIAAYLGTDERAIRRSETTRLTVGSVAR